MTSVGHNYLNQLFIFEYIFYSNTYLAQHYEENDTLGGRGVCKLGQCIIIHKMERVLTPVKRRRRPILLNIDTPSPNRYWDWMPSGRRTKWARDCTGGWSEKEEVGTWWRHDKDILPVLRALCVGKPPVTDGFTQTGSVMRSTGWYGRPIYCIVKRLSIYIYIYIYIYIRQEKWLPLIRMIAVPSFAPNDYLNQW